MSKKLDSIPISDIVVEKHNVRTKDITVGIEDLAASIKATGLLQPLTVYFNSEKNKYVLLAGQRRFNAFVLLNDDNPNEGFDKIECNIIDEPKTDEEKLALSLAENITQLQMHNSDLVKAVTDLFNVYRDYDIVKEKFGLTKYMIDKYVRLARLPERLKKAINDGEINPDNKKAENAALRAVDALGWIKGGDILEDDVVELAVEYARGDITTEALTTAAKRGGSIDEIKAAAAKKVLSKQTIELSIDVAAKLKKVAEFNGESEKSRATHYVVKGATRDYSELEG